MKTPNDIRYSRTHEWVRLEEDVATVGITDYAQQALGDIVYVELPAVGKQFDVGQVFGTVESVKAVSDVFLPVSGEVLETNMALVAAPELVNQDVFGVGWLVRVRVVGTANLSDLMDAATYETYCADLAH
jgi:glycine cleavage system H protein